MYSKIPLFLFLFEIFMFYSISPIAFKQNRYLLKHLKILLMHKKDVNYYEIIFAVARDREKKV